MRGFKFGRTWGGIAAAILAAGLLGTVFAAPVWAQPGGPPSVLEPASPASAEILDLHNIVLIIAVVIFVIVEGLLLVAALRFRRRASDTSEPVQIHGNARLELAWTIAPAVIVFALFVLTVRAQQTIDASAKSTDGSPPLTVEVVGHQWWWEFRYPDLQVITAGELVIPTGRLVNLTITSVDVIHSFWVPELSGKTDAIKDVTNRSWLKTDRAGTYYGQCAELCGVSHANMRLVVRAVSPDEFTAWTTLQTQEAVAPADPLAQTGQQFFAAGPCTSCHTIRGVAGAAGKFGPDLTHVAGRPYIAGGILATTPHNLARWLDDPPGVKPGSLMPDLGLAPADIDALVAYLQTLK